MSPQANVNSKQRAQFLEHWNRRYPSFSGDKGGRLHFENAHCHLLRSGQIVQCWSLNERVIFWRPEDQLFDPWSVLMEGDWVEVFSEQETNGVVKEGFQLLSPNLLDKGTHEWRRESVAQWMSFVRSVREFFNREGFQELQTPTLVPCPGTEPFLFSYSTVQKIGSTSKDLYLPTSPELHLKKAIARGWDPIFEIRPCFRNNELSPQHQPEFYMLEWYRPFSTMEQIQADIKKLAEFLDPSLKSVEWVSRTMQELFLELFDFHLTPKTSVIELESLAKRLALDIPLNQSFDDVFFYIYVEKIEPYLKKFEFLILKNYPPSQAALARLTEEGWGDRFEFYIRGMEIANAFNELNDPIIQRQRSKEDLDKKRDSGFPAISLDEDFFKHLEGGMPPSCGIALGVERLFMALSGYQDIKDFRLFFTETDSV